MRLRSLAILIGVFSLATASATQQKPDFSGTWAAGTDAPAGVAAAPSPVMGPRFAIRHEGGTLAITRPVRDEHVVATFKLDGSRTTYRIPGRMCEGDSEYSETVAWEEGALALTAVGVVPAGGGAAREMSVKRILRREGDTLVVQGSMTQAGQTRAVATVYKRSDPLPAPTRPAPAVKGTPGTIAQVGWISGFWVGTNGTLTTEERWTPAASGGIIGLGRSLRGTALASFEFLCISEKEGSLVYTAMPDGRTTPTHFVLTGITHEVATFENPAHDFPKMIRYSLRPDGSLETAIAGAAGARLQTFVLKRQQ